MAVAQGTECGIRMDVRFHADVADPLFAFALRNDLGTHRVRDSTQLQHGPTGRFRRGRRGDRASAIRELARAGPLPADRFGGPRRLWRRHFDLREAISSILVHSTSSGGGAADLPHSFEIERG